MRKFLKDYRFEFGDDELDSLIHLLAGAQAQRFAGGMARTEEVTRSTTLVVLSHLSAEVTEKLVGTGIDWVRFQESIGLPVDQSITPKKVRDVNLNRHLEAAIIRYDAENQPPHRLTPELLATVITEHMLQDPEAGQLAHRFKEFGADFARLPLAFPIPDEPDPPRSMRRVAWLCQYLPGDSELRWIKDAQPGAIIPWMTRKSALPREMQVNDPVIYWRTINNEQDRGGLVGTGHVESIELELDSDGQGRLPTKVHEFFDEQLIPRDEVIEFAGITRRNWQGAVLKLEPDEAAKVDELLLSKGRLPIFLADSTQIRVQRDAPESEYDSLGRASLAVSLAWTLHEIWCMEQGLDPFPRRTPEKEAAGFVVHIDSPWGGGKTTFANFIMRTLNPGDKKRTPEFLKRLYPDRDDMSGLFIPDAHEKGKLKKTPKHYRWDLESRRPWITVPFNAWLHQHVEPPWWCFYQEIRKACFRAARTEGLPAVYQNSDGTYYTQKDNRVVRFRRWIELWGGEFWWRLTNRKVLSQLAVFLVSFFVAFLIWKFGGIKSVGGKPVLSTSSDIGLVIAFLTGAGSFITTAVTIFSDALAPGRNLLGERVTLGSGDPLKRFRKYFCRMIRNVKRPVLVVVDDLDRCRPEFIVELVRGLQTILLSPRIIYLILGDRNWIEQAFEVQHEDMNKIDVGPEHTFGGRFVEKAIQLSFALPAIADHQNDYVQEVLMGRRDQREEASASKSDDDRRISLRGEMAKVRTPDAIDKMGSDLEKGTRGQESPDRLLQQTVREEVILRRAAQKEEVKLAIQHRLQAIAEYLPNNPRHIKRIINAISLYQDSILLTRGTIAEAGFGKKHWRELVVGVVLMMGFPKSWSTLAANPFLANYLIEGDSAKWKNLGKDVQEQLSVLCENEAVIGLLSRTEFYDDAGAEPVKTILNDETIRWLSQVIPVNS